MIDDEKKIPKAQEIDDDSLEEVSGGAWWTKITRRVKTPIGPHRPTWNTTPTAPKDPVQSAPIQDPPESSEEPTFERHCPDDKPYEYFEQELWEGNKIPQGYSDDE
ncbi:MAG: hypothetical protein Q4C42_00015 [Clostridia bacterium]|nr:hypothetical protein [Clostridia bacterium]